jgi:hypothetical protein
MLLRMDAEGLIGEAFDLSPFDNDIDTSELHGVLNEGKAEMAEWWLPRVTK